VQGKQGSRRGLKVVERRGGRVCEDKTTRKGGAPRSAKKKIGGKEKKGDGGQREIKRGEGLGLSGEKEKRAEPRPAFEAKQETRSEGKRGEKKGDMRRERGTYNGYWSGTIAGNSKGTGYVRLTSNGRTW